ncbi:MAG TPA: hypothetical protein VM369_01865 [Candidatus Binatia bacterium]|nr:hypothetical protein [Candidatus Binatia bacterium]
MILRTGILPMRHLLLRLAAACLMAAPLLAPAATPDSGTLSESVPDLSYSADVQALPNASAPASGAYKCDATNPCDEFALTVELPADYIETYPDATITVAAAATVDATDIDLQVSDDKGNVVVVQRDNPPDQPSVTFFPAGGTQHFIVQVVPGTPNPGASVTIHLNPGDAAKSGVLAGGAAGGALLLPLLAGALLRRRR